jgi:hypothetical protein
MYDMSHKLTLYCVPRDLWTCSTSIRLSDLAPMKEHELELQVCVRISVRSVREGCERRGRSHYSINVS